MAIRAKKVGEDLFTAELTLPDMSAVAEDWSTPEPMSRDQLAAELIRRGCHQQDIGDALDQADRDWVRGKVS